MASRVLRMFFDRGVVFVPADGRVLLSFHGEDVPPMDLTDDFALLLEAGLLLLDERPVAESQSGVSFVDVATLDVPDRTRVYHDGRRLSHEEIGAAVEMTLRSALRAVLDAS